MDRERILLDSAFRSLVEGDSREAERLYKEVGEGPENGEALLGLAVAYLRLGRGSPLDTLAEIHPDMGGALQKIMKTSELSEITRSVKDVLDSCTDDNVARLCIHAVEHRAEVLLNEGEFGPALSIFDSIATDTNDPDKRAWGIMRVIEAVELSFGFEAFNQALSDLDQELADRSRDAVSRQFVTNLERERFDRALMYVENFDFLDKEKLIDALDRNGRNHEEYGNVRDALSCYDMIKGLSDDPAKINGLGKRVLGLAKKAVASGDNDQALFLLIKANEYSEVDIVKDLAVIAQNYVKGGEYKKAVALYLRISDFNPEYKTAYHLKDVAHRLKSEGKYKAAHKIYRKVMELDPDFDMNHYNYLLGQELLEQKEYGKAVKVFSYVKKNSYQMYVTIASAEENAGNRAGAMKTLKQAHKRWPREMKVLHAITDLFDRQKQPDKAFAFAQKAMNVDKSSRWAKERVKKGFKDRIEKAEKERDYFKAFNLYGQYMERFPNDAWAVDRRELCLKLLKTTNRKQWKTAKARLDEKKGSEKPSKKKK